MEVILSKQYAFLALNAVFGPATTLVLMLFEIFHRYRLLAVCTDHRLLRTDFLMVVHYFCVDWKPTPLTFLLRVFLFDMLIQMVNVNQLIALRALLDVSTAVSEMASNFLCWEGLAAVLAIL